jgi:hypothetical protein
MKKILSFFLVSYRRLFKYITNKYYDSTLSVDTKFTDGLPDTPNGDSHKLNNISYTALVEIYNFLSRRGVKFNTYIDFGSGSGRSIFFFANKLKCAEFIGVEFSEKAHYLAKLNLTNYMGKNKNNISIYRKDVCDYNFSGNEDLLFFFNPFGIKTFTILLDNIIDSNKFNGKKICILYAYPFICHELIIHKMNVKQTEIIPTKKSGLTIYFYEIEL